MDKDGKVTYGSGAQSSVTNPCYDEVPIDLERRIAARYFKGHRYGRGNWLRGLQKGKLDVDFMRDRYNHAREHLNFMRYPGLVELADDNIGAVGWFLGFACEVERITGLTWPEILKPRTPEDEAKWRKSIGALPAKENK